MAAQQGRITNPMAWFLSANMTDAAEGYSPAVAITESPSPLPNRSRRKKADPVHEAVQVVEEESIEVVVEEASIDVIEETSSEVASEQRKPRVLTFDRFSVAGTAERPIFVVEVEHLRTAIPNNDRLHGWLTRLNECLGRFEDRNVYSFTREKLQQFLRSVKSVVTSRHGSSHQHVDWVAIGVRTRLPPELASLVSVSDFPEYQIEDYADRGTAYTAIAAAVLSPTLKRKVIFVTRPEFSDRGAFQIYIPGQNYFDNHRYESVPSLFGFERRAEYTGRVNLTLFESARTDCFFITDNQNKVAEVHPNALFILAALDGSFQSLRIFYRILMDTVKLLGDPNEYERLRADMERQFQESQRTRIIDCATRAADWIKKNRAGDRTVNRRTHLEKAIKSTERLLNEMHAELMVLRDSNNTQSMTDRITRDFNALIGGKIAMVKRVFFDTTDQFHMVTEPIVAFDRHTKKYHLLGECEMIVDLPGASYRRQDPYYTSDGVRIIQYDVGQNRRPLPHCGSAGNVCFGNIRNEINALVSGFEIQALASLVIAFLQRPNVYDIEGARVRGFPETTAPTGHDSSIIEAAASDTAIAASDTIAHAARWAITT